MAVGEGTNARPLEPGAGVLLRSVRHDQVGTEGKDPFRVGIDERTDLWQRADFRGEGIEAADGNDFRTGSDGKEHLGHGGHQ